MYEVLTYSLQFLVFLFSMSVHQYGHVFGAWSMGYSLNKKKVGQVCDPWTLLVRERFGMVFFPILSIWAYGVPLGYSGLPIDAKWAEKNPRRVSLVALSGVLGNLALLLISLALVKLCAYLDFLHLSGEFGFYSWISGNGGLASGTCAMILASFLWVNLCQFFFSLLPVPPLDGFICLGFLWKHNNFKSLRNMLSQPIGSILLLSFSLQFIPAFAPKFFEFVWLKFFV
ncbi:MAG: hypothetical protein OXT67_02020 [Zetaproteobacteria bacterium]|nr:hypothetical protein [Zetaproteobacteria bacterium]